MRTLILAAGRFGDPMRRAIEAGKEPRLDVFEIAEKLGADVLDYLDVERSLRPSVRVTAKSLGPSAALAQLGYTARKSYDAFLTTGEDIGLPLALLLKAGRVRASHTMITHTLFPNKKRVFLKPLGLQSVGVGTHVDRFLVYSSSEERLAIDTLGVPPSHVERIYYHADQRFFRPMGEPLEPGLICAAGQLLRDYDCLIEAVRGLPVKVQIAAGSPWIEQGLAPTAALPENVTWGKLGRFELRALYARSAVAVVPIKQNHYQTGIATILEMMAMGKCVVASKTHGQTDTIVDGVTGVYVPPGDAGALRSALQGLLADPARAERIGTAARRFMEEQAGLDHFVERIVRSVRAAHAQRLG